MIEYELWLSVQEKMEERSQRLLNDKGVRVPNRARSPKYPLSGLLKCGACGNSYVMASDRLACDGRRLGMCENTRRVRRDDLQAAVFDALKHRLLSPQILTPYLGEYRREYAEAVAEQAVRTTSIETRRGELDRQIQNIMATARAGAISSEVAALWNEELNRLSREKKRLEQEAARSPSSEPLPMEDGAIIERLRVMLDDLGAALEGGQRDAARARDILRSFIDRVVITPHETALSDGRGCGPVRVTVEGGFAGLLGLASLDRVMQRRERTFTTLNSANSTFSIYVDLPNRSSIMLDRTFADIALFAGMLDNANAPVAKRDLIAAIEAALLQSGAASDIDAFQRASAVIRYLRGADLIRPITVRPDYTGWVLNDRDLTDEEWCARGLNPPPPPLFVMRSSPPAAFGVVIMGG